MENLNKQRSIRNIAVGIVAALGLQGAIAQKISCITESNGFFGSSEKTTCYIGNNRAPIKEGEEVTIDGTTYTMRGGEVKSKGNSRSTNNGNSNNCTVESYANEHGAGSRVVCDGIVKTSSQAN